MGKISEAIKEQLDAKGMSQNDIAKKLKTDRSNFNTRLNTETMRLPELKKVCEILGLELILKPINLFEIKEQ